MSKHTPGPWDLFDLAPAINAGNMRKPHGDGTKFRITGSHTLLVELIGCSDGFVYGANEANARLISAAPELLEALESIAEYWNQDRNDQAMHDACWHAIETARAAIARAKGETK
jgi:hypothetical protein